MTPSPSGIRDFNPSSPLHDAFHLWLSIEENQKRVIESFLTGDHRAFLPTEDEMKEWVHWKTVDYGTSAHWKKCDLEHDSFEDGTGMKSGIDKIWSAKPYDNTQVDNTTSAGIGSAFLKTNKLEWIKNDCPNFYSFSTLNGQICKLELRKVRIHYHNIGTIHSALTNTNREIKIEKKQTEMPIYTGYNRFLLGVVDCLMDVTIAYPFKVRKIECIALEEDMIDNKYGYKVPRGIDVVRYDHKDVKESMEYNDREFSLSVEIKPNLNSISSTMGQIKAYRNCLNRDRLKTILLTTDDQPTKFDNLFKSEDINIFRIPKQEIDELL